MSDWTPTTEQVRDGYRYDLADDFYNPLQAGSNATRSGRAFDRWLEQVKQEARAEGWDEGHESAALRIPEGVWHDTASPRTPNPYREKEQD